MGSGYHGGFNKEQKKTGGVGISMPNAHLAVTPKEKFINYSLDPYNVKAKGKAEAYERGLGFNRQNADLLISQIHEAVTIKGAKAYDKCLGTYGIKYRFRIPVLGINGKTKNVIVVYQIDTDSTIPRMVTNYLEAK